MKTALFAVIALLSVVAVAQQGTLGTVSTPTNVTCTSDFSAGSSCQHVTVTCGGVANLGVTIGFKAGAVGRGTVSYWAGNGGNGIIDNSISVAVNKTGLATRQVKWDSPWQATGNATPNVFAAACRPATLANYLESIDPAPHCRFGKSMGASAVAYMMSDYPVPAPKKALFVAGPVASDFVNGCEVPSPNTATVTVEPTDGAAFTNWAGYVPPFARGITIFTLAKADQKTGAACQSQTPTSTADDASWALQQINQPSSVVTFPDTNISAYVCSNDENNSAAQAQLYLGTLPVGTYSLTAMSSCPSSEAVEQALTPQNVKGAAAIEADLEASCQ